MSTASGLEREYNCPGSTVLPRHGKTSEVAERGTEIHAFVRRVLRGSSREAALAYVPGPWKATCFGIDFSRFVGDLTNVRSEMAFAYESETNDAYELGQNIGRNYPAPKTLGTIYGSSDIIGKRADGVMVVADVKTGWGEVTEPEANFQLLFFALVLSVIYGSSQVESRLVHVRTDGKVFVESFVYDAFAMDVYADKLDDLVSRKAKTLVQYQETGHVEVNEGPWCKYCPARSSCPAKVSLMRRMLPELEAIQGKVYTMTQPEKGRAWELAHDKIKPLLETVLDSLKDSAKEELVPLPNGKVLGPSASPRETFDQALGIALLRKLGATDSQIDDCYRTAMTVRVIEMKPETAAKKAAGK